MTLDKIGPHGPFEYYRPRAVTQAGSWQVGRTSFKVYGLLADDKALTPEIMQDAEAFVRCDLPAYIASEGAENGGGFVIVHPGDFGVSTVAHWWVQGSVLCQRIRRKLYGSDQPMNVTSRPVVACIWELAVIDAEQKIWRETMMGDEPDLALYLNQRVAVTAV